MTSIAARRPPTILKKPPASSSSTSSLDKINLKIEVRLLPPNLTEDDFYNQLSKVWIKPITSKYYVQGKYPDNAYESPQYSRAYLFFKTELLLNEFISILKGKAFQESDTKDNLVPIIERSLFGEMPGAKGEELKLFSLDNNVYFKRFIDYLEKGNSSSILKAEKKVVPREKTKKSAKKKKTEELAKTKSEEQKVKSKPETEKLMNKTGKTESVKGKNIDVKKAAEVDSSKAKPVKLKLSKAAKKAKAAAASKDVNSSSDKLNPENSESPNNQSVSDKSIKQNSKPNPNPGEQTISSDTQKDKPKKNKKPKVPKEQPASGNNDLKEAKPAKLKGKKKSKSKSESVKVQASPSTVDQAPLKVDLTDHTQSKVDQAD